MGNALITAVDVERKRFTIRVIDRRAKTYGHYDVLPYFPEYCTEDELPVVGKKIWLDNIDTPWGQTIC